MAVNYAGTFELQIHVPSLADAIEEVCPMHTRHRSDYVANMEWQKERATVSDLCNTIRTICRAIDTEFEKQGRPREYFHLVLTATIWKTENGGWLGSATEPKALPGFPNCSIAALDFSLTERVDIFSSTERVGFLRISKTTEVTEPDRRDGGDSHRAIHVQKRVVIGAERGMESMLKLLQDEGNLDQVFACFEALT